MDDRTQAAVVGGAMLLWSSLGQVDRTLLRAARWTLFNDLEMLKAGTRRRLSNSVSMTGIAAGVAILAWAAMASRLPDAGGSPATG